MSSAQMISSEETNTLTKEEIKKNQEDFMRADGKMDRYIIEGMLADPDALIAELGRKGIKQAMVLQRAADCGISESILRQMKRVAADLAGDKATKSRLSTGVRARQCLSCDRVFLSTGPGNRLCSRCRGGDAGLAQL
jgi:carbamoylphosphate synthase small subunit